MQFYQATKESLRPNVIRQLAKELKSLDDTPPEGIKVIVNDEDLTIIFAEIDGPGVHLNNSDFYDIYIFDDYPKVFCFVNIFSWNSI